MSTLQDVEAAILRRDIDAIISLFFVANQPTLRASFRTENALWEYKSDCPQLGRQHENGWANISKDVLAFHNNRGGIMVFGINDNYEFIGATTRLDSKLINDGLRRYVGDKLWVDYYRTFISVDQRYLGLALIPARGPLLERFKHDAPMVSGKTLFRAQEAALREGDSSRLLTKEEADTMAARSAAPHIGQVYAINEPMYRLLNPDYRHFVERESPCRMVERSLNSPRTSVTSIIGIGGVGKTALAVWAAMRCYERKQFEFMVSITAKDRELTTTGILGIEPKLTSFESLLDGICDVLGFPDIKTRKINHKERDVRELLEETNGLLFVDNLETVDDRRIIDFLDDLPMGTRAIVTSRRTRVRVAAFPVELQPMDGEEVARFVASLANEQGFAYVSGFSKAERVRIGQGCDFIPLAIRWVLARSKSAAEALAIADSLSQSGRHGEELLEFSFRRVFEEMTPQERAIVEVLSLFQSPIPTEALIVGSGDVHERALDAVDELVGDSVIQRFFDPDRNDYTYGLLPVARAFIYGAVSEQANLEARIRARLERWFEARDINDPGQRIVVREIRQGKDAPEAGLIDLARSAQQRGDIKTADQLFKQALQRNPRSWKAARLYAEFQRHALANTKSALELYAQAAAHAPRRGADRGLIFREWGMLLRNSGLPDATDLAIEKFETALVEMPNDPITIHALATMYDRKGAYYPVIELLEPLESHPDMKTREMAVALLLKAHERLGNQRRVAELQTVYDKLRP